MKRIFQFSHCTLHLYRKKIILFSVLSIGSSLISLFNTLLSGRFIDFLASPNCVEWKPQLCYYCILFLATIMISFAISFALGRISCQNFTSNQCAPRMLRATEPVLNSVKHSSTVYPTMLQIELMASPDIATFWSRTA